MLNENLIREFTKLIRKYEHSEGDVYKHKARAMVHVVKVLKSWPSEITDVSTVAKVKGFGEGTLERVREILATGKLVECEGIDIPKERSLCTTIHGVGPVGAQMFRDVYKIVYADELIDAWNAGKIHPVHVTNAMGIGMKYHYDIIERIPRAEIKMWKQKVKGLFPFKICGSYRRKAETCGDIDMLTTSNLVTCVRALKSIGLVSDADILGMGPTKFMGITYTITASGEKKFRRLDIRCVPEESFPFALLYYTGSDEFNKRMRLDAIRLRLTLNEYGLFKVPEMTPVEGLRCEADIFRHLFIEYRKPKDRSLI